VKVALMNLGAALFPEHVRDDLAASMVRMIWMLERNGIQARHGSAWTQPPSKLTKGLYLSRSFHVKHPKAAKRRGTLFLSIDRNPCARSCQVGLDLPAFAMFHVKRCWHSLPCDVYIPPPSRSL
jgi:hypothetical protein